MAKKTEPIRTFQIVDSECYGGLLRLCPEEFSGAKSYATRDLKLKLYADMESGRKIPDEWKNKGATIIAKKLKDCIIYYTVLDGRNKRI